MFQVILSGCFLCLAFWLVRDEVWGIDLTEDRFRLVESIILAGVAVWGLITAIGVWRVRPWGRTSALRFSCAVVLAYLPNVLWYAYVVKTSHDVGWSWEILYPLVPLCGAGIWWLVLFTRPKVKDQFFQQSKSLSPVN